MFNEPVTGERFFGREDVLELLNRRVIALKDGYRQNMALTGQSLAGKSSVILHFLHSIEGEGFIPIYVEVVKEPFSSFSDKFIATLLYNTLLRIGENADVRMGSLLELSQRSLPKTYSAIKQINSCIDRDDIDEAYSRLLELTSIVKEETSVPSIVILDEFDNLENLGVKNPFLNFGKVIMVQKDTMYIVSSSRNEAIKKIISEKLSLLFGNFEIVKVSNFDVATSNRFIGTRLAGFDVPQHFRNFLIDFTDGNPFYLDKILARLGQVASERMSNYIDKDVICKAVLELVYDSGGAIHQYLFNFILDMLDSRYREEYLLILLAIASGANKCQEIARRLRKKQAEAAKALARLIELGVVSKNGVFYKIEDAMLGFWLRHVYRRKKELLIGSGFDKMGLFAGQFESYLSKTTESYQRGLANRLAELFNSFFNDMVQLDSKNIRLPRFTKVEMKYFADSKPYIYSSFRGNIWIAQPYERMVNENDIVDYIRNLKGLGCKIANKIIMPLYDMDENAKLLAKELKISIWDISQVNMLLNFYGKNRIILQ